MGIKDLRIEIAPGLRKLDVYTRREVLAKSLEGEMSTAFKGRGIEFAGFRKYFFGDDANSIDWKASKRANEILIREFEEYKNSTIFILFDVSDSMLYSSTEKLKCEYSAELVYVLADAMLKAGHSVGLSMFNDDIVNTIYPGTGDQILNNIRTNISKGENYGGGFDLKKALLLTKSLLGSRAVVVIVSDMLGLSDGWESYIKMLGSGFEVINIMVADPNDLELPDISGRVLIQDPYSNNNMFISVKDYKDKYKQENLNRVNKIKSVLTKSKGDFLLVRSDKDFVEEIVRFFNRRAKISE